MLGRDLPTTADDIILQGRGRFVSHLKFTALANVDLFTLQVRGRYASHGA
jgi:hypothetical protein